MNLVIFLVPAVTAIVLLVSIVGRKMEWFVDFLTRLCVGGLALYITGELMLRISMQCQIGVNSVTLTSVGLLGVPGYFLILSVEILNSIK